MQDNVNKLLFSVRGAPENKWLWGLVVMEITRLLGLQKSSKHPTMSCNQMWGEILPDVSKVPHVSFGARVYGHIPLAQQTKLGGHEFPALALGVALNVTSVPWPTSN